MRSGSHGLCAFDKRSIVMSTLTNSGQREEIRCTSPPKGNSILVPLEVSLNDQDYTDSRFSFLYYEDPMLSRVMPVSGPAVAAGTAVTVFGKGFDVLRGGEYVSCQFGSPLNAAYNERYTITTPLLSVE